MATKRLRAVRRTPAKPTRPVRILDNPDARLHRHQRIAAQILDDPPARDDEPSPRPKP